MKKFIFLFLIFFSLIFSSYGQDSSVVIDKAEDVSVEDSGDYFTSDNVEGALQQLGEADLTDVFWTDYGDYVSQSSSVLNDNIYIRNDFSASNVLYVDESESLMTVNGAISVNDVTISNNLSIYGTVDGRDVATDGAKLDGIEAGAQVNTVDSVNGYTGVVDLTTGDINVSTDKNYVTDAQLVVIGNTSGTNTGDQNLSDYLSKSTSFVGDVTGTYNSTVVGNDSHSHTNATITLASTDLTDTADLLYEAELDTFSELQTQIADKTLVNEEDAVTWDSTSTFNGQIVSNNDLTISENTSATGTLYYVLMDINGDIMGRSAETHPMSSGGGSGTPGGTDGQIQYNNGGSFGGFGNYNDGTGLVTLSNDLSVSQSLTASNVYLQGSGAATITPTSGMLKIDGSLSISNDLTVDGAIVGKRTAFYGAFKMSADKTSGLSAGGQLYLNTNLGSNGVYLTGGDFVLPGGRTYQVSTMVTFLASGTGYGAFHIYDITNSKMLSGQTYHTTAGTWYCSVPLVHIISPTINTRYRLRIDSASNLNSIKQWGTIVTVTEL